MIFGWSISSTSPIPNVAEVLVPFDFGVVYIQKSYIVLLVLSVLVPFDFGVVYIKIYVFDEIYTVLVPFDFGVVYIYNNKSIKKLYEF